MFRTVNHIAIPAFFERCKPAYGIDVQEETFDLPPYFKYISAVSHYRVMRARTLF